LSSQKGTGDIKNAFVERDAAGSNWRNPVSFFSQILQYSISGITAGSIYGMVGKKERRDHEN
jgi:hypothetical protein